MTNRELEMYNEMNLDDLELVVSETNKERMEIVQAIEEGKINEKYGEQKYSKVDKKYSELYILFEKRLAQQHQNFISCFN